MVRYEAKVRPAHRHAHPELQFGHWYEVVPLWPGVTTRMVNLAGERLARIQTARGVVTVLGEHLEFRLHNSG